jgi:tetratricopeptide (TPR) repeat protein
MEDLALSDGTAVGSDLNFNFWDKREKKHADWPINAEISVKAYLRRTIAKYSKAIRLKTNQEQAYYCRGTAKYQLDDYQGAIDDLSKAITLKPDYAEAYLNRAWAHFLLGNKADALGDITKAKDLGYPLIQEALDIFS